MQVFFPVGLILRIQIWHHTSFIDWRNDEGVDDVFILGAVNSADTAAKRTENINICLEVFLQILL